jgi:CheY-like chemotaxis protein
MKKFNCALIIDDDNIVNLINEKLIEKAMIAHEIKTAVNGEQALNVLQSYIEQHNNTSPELILLDINMPFMNGYEFLDYFKLKNISNKNKVKIVILATQISNQELRNFDKYLWPNMMFINKPLTEDKLRDIVGNETADYA